MKILTAILALGVLACPMLGQSSKAELSVQQQILEELRSIHRELHANTTLQLLLAELQIAQTSFESALQKRDVLKAQSTQLQAEKQQAQADVTRIKGAVEQAPNPDLKEQLTSRLEELRENLSNVSTKEEGVAEQLQEANARLRRSELDRNEVQQQISDLVKKLGSPLN